MFQRNERNYRRGRGCKRIRPAKPALDHFTASQHPFNRRTGQSLRLSTGRCPQMHHFHQYRGNVNHSWYHN